MRTKGTSGECLRTRRRNASPSILGIETSLRIASNWRVAIRRKASAPLDACVTSNPASINECAYEFRIAGSSSTMRTRPLDIGFDPPVAILAILAKTVKSAWKPPEARLAQQACRPGRAARCSREVWPPRVEQIKKTLPLPGKTRYTGVFGPVLWGYVDPIENCRAPLFSYELRVPEILLTAPLSVLGMAVPKRALRSVRANG